jgi:hypothetical protein
MALPLAEAFTARSLGVMWGNYKKTLGTAPYLGRQKFGTRKQDSLDLRFIKGKNGLPVSLKASNFDAQAELRDVGGFSDIQNSMPFYREGYMVTEKEEQEYDNYRTSENSSLANNVLREISKKPMMLIEGALVVPERQIWQLLAPTDGVPKVKVVLGDKNYVVDYTATMVQSIRKSTLSQLPAQVHGISLPHVHRLMTLSQLVETLQRLQATHLHVLP